MKPYFETSLGKLYNCDCLEFMKTMEDKSVDLVLTDPPFNINKAGWDKINNYIEWLGQRFLACQKVLKDNGSFYWFHNDMPQIAELMGWIDKNTDFIFKQMIVWNKRFRGAKNKGFLDGFVAVEVDRNYRLMVEYILFYTFQDETGLSKIMGSCVYPVRNYIRKEIIRAKGKIVLKEINQVLGTADNGGGVASAVLSEQKTVPAMITKEHYKTLQRWLNETKEYEYLRKEYEDLRKEYKYLRKEYEYLRKEYEDLRYTFNNQKTHHSVWDYDFDSQKFRHITPKPINLIINILKHSSNEGFTVLDPFLGSGTTAVACEKLGRRWIACEISEVYCSIAAKRIKAESDQMKLFI